MITDLIDWVNSPNVLFYLFKCFWYLTVKTTRDTMFVPKFTTVDSITECNSDAKRVIYDLIAVENDRDLPEMDRSILYYLVL